MRESAAAIFRLTNESPGLLAESQIVNNATACVAVVFAVAVAVALVVAVAVVGGIGVVAASAVTVVARSLVVPDCLFCGRSR